MTPDQCERARELRQPTIAINDAWRLAPWADVLYGADQRWWQTSGPTPEQFHNDRWSVMCAETGIASIDPAIAADMGIKLVNGAPNPGFCFEPGRVHLGQNSGFQAVNLALQFGAETVWLLGFDMQPQGDRRHFFGEHPAPLNLRSNYNRFIAEFNEAARLLPSHIDIFNCTPGSALRCFERGRL